MVNKKQEYFAEHETDRILRERFFPNREVCGVMVEVGGGTPEFLSMSKHFHESGWRTLAVEPNPMFAAAPISVVGVTDTIGGKTTIGG